MRWLATAGHAVTGIDRSPEAIAAVAPFGTAIQADIENGPWPLSVAGQTATFDAVVVTHYLWRALFPTLLASVAPGGVLIYETFSAGNETVGKPSNPNFLLRPSELLAAFPGLHIVAFEEGFLDAPARYVQRLVAVRADPAHTAAEMPRFPLA
jgi:SAM-dependent methyltransferase